ncbi:Cadherin-related tumor suppressor [Papilio machaon]|uniref:Cadherin-related tumor suppressor n=1 Tax=Papilio machaon TaxID=76193 RepID=A0A194RJ62_PAPMA|nr:Cadherin-related tumor suppressor [Papilio machaon]
MTPVNVIQTRNLRVTLETILGNAKKLADSLKAQISIVQEKEERLKDTIVNGRFGITTLTVSTLRKLPKNYIIRDGYWTLCNGILQHPTTEEVTAAAFSDLYAVPRCIGQEVTSKPDPCVFNSVIKYDTIPSQKRPEYSEDEYLCLKPTFNTTLEQYFSVTKRIVNQTCKSGVIRSIADNVLECGVRVLSDYTYYPNKEVTSYLPLEYCEGTQGSCNLIVAWHLSNSSVTDTNDNPPAFKENAYSFDIPENAARGSVVGTVAAIDLDSGPNAQLTYTVVSDWANDVFSLNPQTGVFTLTARLDYEEVRFH